MKTNKKAWTDWKIKSGPITKPEAHQHNIYKFSFVALLQSRLGSFGFIIEIIVITAITY